MPRYVDAEAFEIDILERYCEPCKRENKDPRGPFCLVCGHRHMIEGIHDAPTADVQEVKHGHWIKTEYAWSICSNCHSTPRMYFPFNYCPWCGAKMDEETEDEKMVH